MSNWQGVIDSIDDVGGYADDAVNGTLALEDTQAIFDLDSTDPFSMARGMVTILSDFEWVAMLFGWFAFAFILIIIVEAIRLVVSLWGIIQRIIALIDLIPFT